jgi:hypothetical protein
MDRLSGFTRSTAAALLFLAAVCGPASAQPTFTSDERVALPAGKDSQDLVLRLPAGTPDGAVTVDALRDSRGQAVSPQPTVTADAAAAGATTLHFKDVHFWGEARLKVTVGGRDFTYTVQRGLELARTAAIVAGRGIPAELWFYNQERNAITPAWRLISDGEAVCGVDSNGAVRRDCNSEDRWSYAKFPPGGSGRISIPVPDWWFHPWRFFAEKTRQVAIELRYGTGDAAPLQRIDFQLGLPTHLGDLIPSWVWSASRQIADVTWALIWVSVGSALLMAAQVMIPNLRKCLRMETQLGFLHERLRAIGSRVGDRLYTRCEQEIKSLSRALGMEKETKGRFGQLGHWPRFLLSANTAEVNRLAGVVPRIESRLRLTEQLDEVQAATTEADLRDLPPTLCLEREKQIKAIRAILSRQFITDAEEKSASGMLDDVADIPKSLKDFGERLEGRLSALRRLYKADTRKSTDPRLTTASGCSTLLKDPPDPAPGGGWSTKELIGRDLCVIKLEIVFRMIDLSDRLARNKPVEDAVNAKLQSDDPDELTRANTMLSMLSEGVSDQDLEAAMAAELWDAFYEPNTITDQDVVRASFLFRDKTLNRRAARSGFECWWHITVDKTALDIYEHGWEVQFIAPRGQLEVTPEIYKQSGVPVTIRSDSNMTKGQLSEQVGRPKSDDALARTLRGAVDAMITALVPVVTVAVTQGAGTLDVGKLILLGFSSQAIRAAVIPEAAATTNAETQPAKPAP